MTHDMDSVSCPSCGGDTVRGLVEAGKPCGKCLKARHPKFQEFKVRVLSGSPEALAAYQRAQIRDLTEGLDKRQARRARRRYYRGFVL